MAKPVRDPQPDEVQGADERRTEAYGKYDEGAEEPATQQFAGSTSGVASSDGKQAGAVRIPDIEEAILYAKKYLEDLLSFFGLNTDVHASTQDHEVIELNIPSTHLNGFLIGVHGDTARALQYLVSTALRNQNFSCSRVNVDVADYKKHRAERLAKTAEEWFREVRDSGQAKDLQPMNAADRRIVHQAASDYGLQTQSIGEGRDRHIVLKPSGPSSDENEEKSEEE